MIIFETAPEIGILPIFALLMVMCFLVATAFRKMIGEQRWAKLMGNRRRRMALGVGIIIVLVTINLISR